MFITLHCGGMPFNGKTIETKSLGGSESAAFYLAKELAAEGHKVTMFTNSQDTGIFDDVRYEWAGNQTEAAPMGERFTFYAEHTPCDVLIAQRHPQAFARKYASKINLWWLHDLALLRHKDAAIGQMWNIDRIMCVSEFHKKQICETWGIPEATVAVINNGVDLSMYKRAGGEIAERVEAIAGSKTRLFYSSRPERGLLNLVGPGGIMDQLADEPVHLFVCGYENTTPQMAQLYNFLWQRCEELPNVTNLGSLTKHELAQLQMACDTWIYPTEFEEVSCITAMEAMAAGCGVIASSHAALPETCAGSSAKLIPLKDGHADVEAFVHAVKEPVTGTDRQLSLERARQLTWVSVAQNVMATVREVFAGYNSASLVHHFIRHSDIVALHELSLPALAQSAFTDKLAEDVGKGYAFYRNNTYAQHYADYYQYEKDRGVNYGPEDVTGTNRFQAVANVIGELPDGSRVLDYGCAHGHYTVALAKRFPKLNFTGLDLAQSNVDTARKWASDKGLANVQFEQGDIDGDAFAELGQVDCIIAAEVIEHVGDAQRYVDALCRKLNESGRMIITTPYGPWEAIGYREHGYWRAHLHHFEREDLHDMFGLFPNFKVLACPHGASPFGSALGSYITLFSKPETKCGAIDYNRKLAQTVPDQTLSCCMIVKDAEADILRCLRSVVPHVQEFIIGIDGSTSDQTREIIGRFELDNPLVAFDVFDIPSASETGFSAARNATIERASCDWILWIDSDEVLVGGDQLPRFMRNSMYNGLAIKQHHMSQDPVAEIKIDLPCRVFRNRKGIKFHGLVHEHPEIEMNKGIGPTLLAGRPHIVHHGYTTEGVRRKRFDRNLPLLARDRKEHPDRVLGKYLWLRDLAQACQYEQEVGALTDEVVQRRAKEGIELFGELLDSENFRIVLDAIPYYSQLVVMSQDGLELKFSIADGREIDGCFANREHLDRLMRGLTLERTANFGARYQ